MANNERVVAENTERAEPVVPLYQRDVVSIAVVGIATGIITWSAMMLLERFVFAAVMCRDDSTANCADAGSYAMIVAMILGGLAALIALVQARIYRPLLVVIAATAALWGFSTQLLGGIEWYIAVPVVAILFGLTYVLFAWIARLRSFVLSVVLIVLLVVAIRLVLNS